MATKLPFLTSAVKVKKHKRTFICGLDGSQLSLRSVQVAAQMVDQYNDNMLIVTLGREESDKEIFSRFSEQAKAIAQRCGVPALNTFAEYVSLPNGFKVDDALVFLGNQTNPGGAVLVIGAAGKGIELKYKGAKPPGQAPLGSLAMACVQRCKQPVVLVKPGPAAPSGSERIKRAGRDGSSGITVMVSLDETEVSRKAFDIALTFGTRGGERKKDTVLLYHVLSAGEKKMEAYEGEVSKIADTYHRAELVCEERGTREIKQHIEDFAEREKVDMIIMGSNELSTAAGSCTYNLGSVTSAVAKSTVANVCIVKNFALKFG